MKYAAFRSETFFGKKRQNIILDVCQKLYLRFAANYILRGCVKRFFTALRAELFGWGLCKKVFAAFGGRIFF